MWARGRLGAKVDFLCVSVAGRQVASQFLHQINIQTALLGYCDNEMPRFGQLGCGGFVVLDGEGKVANPKTPAFLQVGEQSFSFVETLLGKLGSEMEVFYFPFELQEKQASQLKRIALDRKIDVSQCLEKQDFSDAIVTASLAKKSAGQLKKLAQQAGIDCSDCLERKDFVDKIMTFRPTLPNETEAKSGSKRPRVEEPSKVVFQELSNPPTVNNAVMDREHEECVQAVNTLAQVRSLAALKTVLYTFAEHFEGEEELMEEKKFGGAPGAFSAVVGHKEDHSRIIRAIEDVVQRVEAEKGFKTGTLITDADLKMIGSLFEDHAQNFDMLYAGLL